MTEPVSRVGMRRSVFTKLLAVMLGIGLVIPTVVGGFFVLLVRPVMNRTAEGLMAEYVELFAATAPTLEAARQAAAQHGVDVRYEGPRGDWTTSEALPSIADANRAFGRPASVGYQVITRPDGSYLFAWSFERGLEAAHERMLLLLLGFLGVIVFAGHAHLRHALRPLEWLQAGVAALKEGNLEVAVPRKTEDEFGELTSAFNRMVERVRAMVQSRDQLLLDVSHELRSPLTRMKVALELCPRDEHHQRLSANIAQMEAMVAELLELERLRQGKGLRIERADLVRVVREVIEACQDQPPGVHLVAAPQEAVVSMDPEKIRRVLSNLLENASKFALPDSAPTRLSLVRSGGALEMRVEDDGPGIPPELLSRVFEPFFRADPSRSRKTGGYGLGLSLCSRVMEAHGGSIAVENRPGRGAAFVLRLPERGP